MNIAVDPRHQSLVSFALLAAAAAMLLSVLLVRPTAGRLEFLEESTSLRITYEKSREALARSAAVRAEVERRQTATDPTALLFHADTAALAGAELQNQLNGLIAVEGGTLSSSAFRASAEDGPLTPLIVSVRLRCSVEALLRILHGIENRSPVLMVETLVVQSRRRSGESFTAIDGDLDVELEVLGFLDAPNVP